MMDVEKRKNTEKRKRPSLKLGFFIATWWLLLIPACAVIIWIGLWFTRPVMSPVFPYATPHEALSLPQSLIPTAEALQDTVPINEDVPVTDDVSLRLSYFEDYYYQSAICIERFGTLEDWEYTKYSLIFINGVRVRRESDTVHGGLSARAFIRCVAVILEPGLHLIEFQLRDSRFGEPIAIQQWAIEVE